MGFFSRKDKSRQSQTPKPTKPSLTTVQSQVSIESSASSIKSPAGTFSSRAMNRSSAGTNHTNQTSQTSAPNTPLSPFSPHIPKIDLPKPPDPELDPAGYLKSLGAVRERCRILTTRAIKNELNHFEVDMRKFPEVVSFVASIIRRDYDAPYTNIPGHGRYQHFSVGGRDRIAHLLSAWDSIENTEKCRRLIDLFLVSVLLDAGAGTEWKYKSTENGRIYRRSEGIAIASLEMFKTGVFSGDKSNKYQVDKEGLRLLTVEKMAKGLQSGPGNEMAGLEGRTQLLIRLADALEGNKEFFGDGRPGNMLDYLLSHPSTQASSMPIVPLPTLWDVLINGLAPIWPPSRTAINDTPLGDAWPCAAMPQPAAAGSRVSGPSFSPFPNAPTRSGSAAAWESILPFHKLTQWLTYSLMQPMQQLMKIHFAGQQLLTGLPEYRNGGLFVDMGVLTLKPDDMVRGLENYQKNCLRTGAKGIEVAPMFEASDDTVVEWRGVTVGFLDRLVVDVNSALKSELAGNELTLPQLLEAGSWKGGREIAEINRPITKEPPILIESDGTVF